MRPENVEISHIAATMDMTPEALLELANNPRQAFCRPRNRPIGAKIRLITPPKWNWKINYQWLGTFIRRELPLHSAAHGSVPGRSPFTAARPHLGPRNLLAWDVKNAFPCIRADRFYLEMLALEFRPQVATLLTKLLLPDGYLPQGGCASNAAIDLFFYRIDCDIERELSQLGARYSRFTDGLHASFSAAEYAPRIAYIFEGNLARLGLTVNTKKLVECGWQPVGRQRVMCGVRVNSPLGTQLPRDVAKKLVEMCESLYRGARSAAPHSLPGLAARRRCLQGHLNQASQADFSPVRDLKRRLNQVDFVINSALARHSIYLNCEWYIKSGDNDEARRVSRIWKGRLAKKIAIAA
jgi:hypothetical protein